MVQGRLTIERSYNYALLEQVAKNDRIYRVTSDDFSPSNNDYRLPQGDELIYLVAKDQHGLLGFCAFWPVNGVTFECHICFLPEAYGSKALQIFIRMFDWIWRNTRAQRICGAIPEYNRLAISFCRRAGCKMYGLNPRSWIKGGKLHDMILMGISRPANL